MKVLLISVFHPELVRGGAQQVAYELFEGLRERDDVEAVFLAGTDQSHPALYKSGARITGFDGRADEHLFLTRDFDTFWHRTSNPLLVESFEEFLLTVKPDVVHFHHFMNIGVDLITLTRRVLPEAKIVLTLHEFLAMCTADGQLRRRTDGSICTGASPVRCHQCFPGQPPETFFMRERWMKRHLSAVDVFTAPSRFMIDIYSRWGLDASRIVHVPNGQRNYNADPIELTPHAKRNRFGFFGQLVDNKGVHVILDAVQLLRTEGFEDFAVELNGDNLRYASPDRRKQIETFLAAEAELPAAKRNVVFNGSYHVSQLASRMTRVDWCIVPSIWQEIFALVISEAWMFGRPVIASNVGAMKERIRHGTDGLLFEVGDARALAQTMRRACEEPGLWEKLSAGISAPPSREQMVDAFCALYAKDRGTPAAVAAL